MKTNLFGDDFFPILFLIFSGFNHVRSLPHLLVNSSIFWQRLLSIETDRFGRLVQQRVMCKARNHYTLNFNSFIVVSEFSFK